MAPGTQRRQLGVSVPVWTPQELRRWETRRARFLGRSEEALPGRHEWTSSKARVLEAEWMLY
ncbi:hypothetical protein GCM10020256_00080 [Streptomyces thermocoprophilus]